MKQLVGRNNLEVAILVHLQNLQHFAHGHVSDVCGRPGRLRSPMMLTKVMTLGDKAWRCTASCSIWRQVQVDDVG